MTLEGADDILIRLLMKADMAITDLHEAKVGRGGGRGGSDIAQGLRGDPAAAEGPENAGAGPGMHLRKPLRSMPSAW
jgi:hypothetical protein